MEDNFKAPNRAIAGLTVRNILQTSPLITLQPKANLSSITCNKFHISSSVSSFIYSSSSINLQIANSVFKKILDTAINIHGGYRETDILNKTFTTHQNYFHETYNDPDSIGLKILLCTFTNIQNGAINSTVKLTRIYSSTFNACSNTGDGGAVYYNNREGTFLCNSNRFFSCISNNGHGGAFYSLSSHFAVFRTDFKNCAAGTGGGGFYYDATYLESDCYVISCLFVDNAGTLLENSCFYVNFDDHPGSNSEKTLEVNFCRFNRKEEDDGTRPYGTNKMERLSEFRNYYEDQKDTVWIDPTNTFTPSPSFTPSSRFTASSMFTASNKFTPSNAFTPSSMFTLSNTFSPSKSLIPPTPSVSPSRSSFPERTSFPGLPPPPTPTASDVPPSDQPTVETSPRTDPPPTTIPVATVLWSDLRVALIIIAVIIALIGIIANLILCLKMCKPNERIAKQVV